MPVLDTFQAKVLGIIIEFYVNKIIFQDLLYFEYRSRDNNVVSFDHTKRYQMKKRKMEEN